MAPTVSLRIAENMNARFLYFHRTLATVVLGGSHQN